MSQIWHLSSWYHWAWMFTFFSDLSFTQSLQSYCGKVLCIYAFFFSYVFFSLFKYLVIRSWTGLAFQISLSINQSLYLGYHMALMHQWQNTREYFSFFILLGVGNDGIGHWRTGTGHAATFCGLGERCMWNWSKEVGVLYQFKILNFITEIELNVGLFYFFSHS